MGGRFLCVLLALLASCYGDQSPQQQEYDTIVIGMGSAGTMAASILAKAGRRVLGLEAQNRIGGRVHTVPFGEGVVEVGAEWIEGTEDSSVYKAAISNNVAIVQQVNLETLRSNGSLAGAAIQELINKGLEFGNDHTVKYSAEPLGQFVTKKLMEYIKEKMPDKLKDKDFIEQLLAHLNLSYDAVFGASDWNDVNVHNDYVPLGGKQHMNWNRNGYKTFFDILLNEYQDGPGLPSLKIKLFTEVLNIAMPNTTVGKVTVTCKDGAVYQADNVIVTMSLGVLKERYTTLFSPPLPQKKERAIKKIGMGVIGKIIFSFSKPWWPEQGTLYGFLWRGEDLKKVPAEDQWVTKIWGMSSSLGSRNAITLWTTTGELTKQVEKMPDAVVKTKLMELVGKFMSNTTIPEPTGMIRSMWFSNEFTRGVCSYESMTAADTPTARADLARPLLDAAGKPRVLFAGEATHLTRFSTVHGAADSGIREAKRLLELITEVKIVTLGKT